MMVSQGRNRPYHQWKLAAYIYVTTLISHILFLVYLAFDSGIPSVLAVNESKTLRLKITNCFFLNINVQTIKQKCNGHFDTSSCYLSLIGMLILTIVVDI